MPAPIRGLRALLAVALLVTAAATPAAAHTDLVSTDPADGKVLSAPPERLTMRFGEDILDGGARVVAQDQSGGKVDLGPAQVNGPELTAAWPGNAAEGTYTVVFGTDVNACALTATEQRIDDAGAVGVELQADKRTVRVVTRAGGAANTDAADRPFHLTADC